MVSCSMKNVFDVLRQKEAELQQIQKEIEALRVAARLLADEQEADDDSGPSRTAVAAVLSRPAPATTASSSPALRPATPVVSGDGYSAARDNALRQFP